MTSGVPWHLRGVRPELIDSAREAARRSGMSVEEWLDAAIAESARNAGIEPAAQRSSDVDDRRSRGLSFSDVSARLDALARQVDHLTQASTNQTSMNQASTNQAATRYPASEHDPYRSTTIPFEGRTSATGSTAAPFAPSFAAPLEQVPSAPSIAGPDGTVDQALAEIEARQRMLDGDTAAAPTDLARAPTQGLSNLEQQLRQINARIEAIRPCGIDSAVETLRDDLAEIGMMLKEALPREAIESLESEIRSLAERIEGERISGAADGVTIAGLERGLAEVRDALQALTPAESLVGFDQAVQGLSQKVDRIASAGQDPESLKQLEGAIGALRGVVSHVASNDALTQLSEEVRSLSTKVDQVTGSDAFAAMEQRIAAIADALQQSHGTPAAETSSLATVVRSLADKVDQLHAGRSDQTAAGFLESRIGALVEKLDASGAHLDHLGAIERGLADLLIEMKDQRMPAAQRTGIESAEAEALKRDVRRTQDSLETVHGTLGHVVDRLATIEAGIKRPSRTAGAPDDFGPESPSTAPSALAHAPSEPAPTDVASAPAATQAAMFRTPVPERRPIDPNLPPDHPLEPGARSRGHSPADRIAASEAALESVRPPVIPDPAGKSNFIAAARRAAQAAMVEAPPPKDKRTAETPGDDTDRSLTDKLGGHIRKLVVAAGVVLLLLGALHFVTTRLSVGATSTGEPTTTQATHDKTPVAEPPRGSAPLPWDRHSTALPSGISSSPTSFGFGSGAPLPAPADDDGGTTGSVLPGLQAATPTVPALPQTSSPQAAPTQTTPADRLPAGIGSAGLRTAAVNGDAAAEFEIATRFADGRGVPQSLAEAAIWFERAASKGLVQAQFRLGGLYEKGIGVLKNLGTARRLYIAAAEAGHAKAMHNLAVIYAEGAGGKPDYASAARWFRKAADHGVTDSQYNLAILYARGIGVQPNMAEAFKWFALASREGDRDAAKKRDDIAARLDKRSLAAAMDAAQAWQAQPQPTAIEVKAPPGGWDGGSASSSAKRSVGPTVDKRQSQPRRPAQ
ncbi:MAG: hypothetical protein GEU95_12455 [Rhizobiales bacterium]|nr:hypothetical protein [Hyphomicrobiales bacterium]